MARVEYAAGHGRSDGASRTSVFPEHWGQPPLDADVRQGWLIAHCRAEMQRKAETRGGLNPMHAKLELLRKRWPAHVTGTR